MTPPFARCRFGSAPPSKICMSQHTHYAGGIKVVTLHKFTIEPTKDIYNIIAKTPTSQESKYIQRSKSYITQNSIWVRTRIQMDLRGLKIMMASITLPRPSQKGDLANVVTSMYLSSNLLRRISETSINKYEVLSKTSRRIKRSQQTVFVRGVYRQARETQKDVGCIVGLSGSEQALKNLWRHSTTSV
jgi:hypothetical protein